MTTSSRGVTKKYQNGQIYAVRNTIDEEFYIGSTCNTLAERMSSHRCEGRKGGHTMKLYVKMFDIGVDNFYIESYELFPCENVQQLRRREGEIQQLLKPTLNQHIAGRTTKEQMHEYYEAHKEELYEKTRQYALDHPEQKKGYQQKYYETHKDEIAERTKEYREEYTRQKNIRDKEKVPCEACNREISRGYVPRHNKSQKHKDNLALLASSASTTVTDVEVSTLSETEYSS